MALAALRMNLLAVSLVPKTFERNFPHSDGAPVRPLRFALNHFVPTKSFTNVGNVAFVRRIFAPVVASSHSLGVVGRYNAWLRTASFSQRSRSAQRRSSSLR